VACKIGRACNDPIARVHQFRHNQIALDDRGETHREVYAVGDEVEIGVSEQALDLEVRIERSELAEQGHDAHLTEGDGRRDAQQTTRPASHLQCGFPRPRDLFGQRLNAGEINVASLCQRHRARGALKQP
jgi:hypothetical protein